MDIAFKGNMIYSQEKFTSIPMSQFLFILIIRLINFAGKNALELTLLNHMKAAGMPVAKAWQPMLHKFSFQLSHNSQLITHRSLPHYIAYDFIPFLPPLLEHLREDHLGGHGSFRS